jgi:hypothetical protein
MKAKSGIMPRLEREGWRLLEKERDEWKVKALAYREIIKRAQAVWGADQAWRIRRILNEADKPENLRKM